MATIYTILSLKNMGVPSRINRGLGGYSPLKVLRNVGDECNQLCFLEPEESGCDSMVEMGLGGYSS